MGFGVNTAGEFCIFYNVRLGEMCACARSSHINNQIIFKTITNNNFRFYYVSSKLDQVLLLLLLTYKLLLLK
jgi:hypothetical protein